MILTHLILFKFWAGATGAEIVPPGNDRTLVIEAAPRTVTIQ